MAKNEMICCRGMDSLPKKNGEWLDRRQVINKDISLKMETCKMHGNYTKQHDEHDGDDNCPVCRSNFWESEVRMYKHLISNIARLVNSSHYTDSKIIEKITEIIKKEMGL